jgi:peptide/nickel transport system ATP-binding protein
MMPEVAGATEYPEILEARHLTKHFGGARLRGGGPLPAVDDVSLTLRAGYAVALVGESGSGKSTLARLIMQLYPVTDGEVRLHGSRAGSDRRRYAEKVQIVFQDPFASLNPVHTIRYSLTRALELHGGVRRRERATALADLLSRVHLEPAESFLDRFPHQLSGGQLQRVAIARALAARPEVLIADEPVSMLDVSIRLGILRLLARLKREENLALLYITHDIASARYFADEILVMYRGELVEGGPAEEITQRPAHPYTRLLIAAAPDLARRDRGMERLPAVWDTSSLRSREGCRFAVRCPHAMPVCTARSPERTELGGGHWARCFLHAPVAAS